MTELEKSTEEIIFEAARTVFIEKGFEGARMQEIAEVADINKALLHYYYRTKEKLFNAIFERVFSQFIPKVLDFIESDKPILEKIEFFIHTYINVLLHNPFIPNFVINELNRNPAHITEMLEKHIIKSDAFGKFSALLHEDIRKGNIRAIEPEQLLVNMLALCIFPFIARPIIKGIFFNDDKIKFQEFLEGRKKEVTSFIINSLIVTNSN